MNTPQHSESESAPPTIEGQLELYLAKKGFMKQACQVSTRKQKVFVKRASQALESDQEKVLGALCKHLAERGNVQSALSYTGMYLDTGEISPATLEHVFYHIVKNTQNKNDGDNVGNSKSPTAPKGLFRIMQKLEKDYTRDVDGTISLIQGKISQVFSADVSATINQYRLALEKKHPQSYFLLGCMLVNHHAMQAGYLEEGLQIFLQGWTELQDIDCLVGCMRTSFVMGNNAEGVKYYQILKTVQPNTPHLMECLPFLDFSEQLPLFIDYIKRHHNQEFSSPVRTNIYEYALSWTRAYIQALEEHIETLLAKKTQLEQEGGDTIKITFELQELSLAMLGVMELGSVYLVDSAITIAYLKKIRMLSEDVLTGKEVLMKHVLNSEGYARKWVEKRSMKVVDMDDVQIDEETGDIIEDGAKAAKTDIYSMLPSGDTDSKPLTEDVLPSPIVADTMGVLNMILCHSKACHDKDIARLYAEIAEKIIPNPEIYALDKTYKEALREQSLFDGMPSEVRDWYQELANTLDENYTPLVRKKIQGAHRIGGIYRESRMKDITLFLILDGLLSGIPDEQLHEYIQELSAHRITYREGLRLSMACTYFLNYEEAFDILCNGMADWSNVKTMILALQLINVITLGDHAISDEMIKSMETSIRGQGHEIDNFQEFIASAMDGQFHEKEDPSNEGFLYELAGLGALLYRDHENVLPNFMKAYRLGNTSAMADMAMAYSWDQNPKEAYRALKMVYDAGNPEMIRKVPILASLAIAIGYRHEVPRYLDIMQKKHMEEYSWIYFYFLATGNKDEEIQAIRSLSAYGRILPETFDPEIVTTTADRMVVIRDDQESTFYDRLSCQRGLGLLESEGQSQAIMYWQMLSKLLIEDNFYALSEHLTEFTDARIQDMYATEKKEENPQYEKARLGLVSEALFFRRERGKEKDFTLLFDLMYRVCAVFPEHEKLIQDWREEMRGAMTPEQAFELGYELERFGETVTWQ